jgi:hypothetical protein
MKRIVAVVAALALVVVASGCSKSGPVDKSMATYRGPIAEYRGSKRLVAAFTASWAPVWAVTHEELKKLDRERFDLMILDDAVDRSEIRRYGVDFLPTIALVEGGRITQRVQNLTSIDQIKDW